MRRNDIVHEKDNGGWVVYGRVVKKLPDGKWLWICCGKHLNISSEDELVVVTDYQGYWREITIHPIIGDERDWPKRDWDSIKWQGNRFYRMPTLRRLKQMASQYAGREVWRK